MVAVGVVPGGGLGLAGRFAADAPVLGVVAVGDRSVVPTGRSVIVLAAADLRHLGSTVVADPYGLGATPDDDAVFPGSPD